MLILRSIFFTFLLPGTVAALIPYLIIRSSPVDAGPLRYTGLPLIVFGAAGLLGSIWQFFVEGKGTLAPVDPPKELVVRGLYRVVRNPMYVSVAITLLGEAIFFYSLGVLAEAGIFVICTHLFIVYYEEPHLREQFGPSYEDYARRVNRWMPKPPSHKSSG